MALAGVCFVALQGCSGRTIQGVWYGDLPGTRYKECRIELRRAAELHASCKSPSNSIVLGSYRLEGDTLTLNLYRALESEKLKNLDIRESHWFIKGPGNYIVLSPPLSYLQEVEWERRPQ